MVSLANIEWMAARHALNMKIISKGYDRSNNNFQNHQKWTQYDIFILYNVGFLSVRRLFDDVVAAGADIKYSGIGRTWPLRWSNPISILISVNALKSATDSYITNFNSDPPAANFRWHQSVKTRKSWIYMKSKLLFDWT